MNLKLKPCPWCKREAELYSPRHGYIVGCPEGEGYKKCLVAPRTITCEESEQAIEYWNKMSLSFDETARESLSEIAEGSYSRKGGTNSPPNKPRPNVKPVGQKPNEGTGEVPCRDTNSKTDLDKINTILKSVEYILKYLQDANCTGHLECAREILDELKICS